MKTLFLIPARGGSKGLPGKNVALVGGIPLVGRAARTAARALRLLGGQGRVVCSTDDEAIAAAAREWGAEIPFVRPAELASDSAASIDVVLHAMHTLGLDGDDLVVLLQPTSPLTDPVDVVEAIALARATGDPVVSVCAAEHPASWQFVLNSEGRLAPAFATESVTRRQDALKSHRLNGAVYVARREQIEKLRGFMGPSTRGLVMPAERSVDIDSALDLDVARVLVRSRRVEPVRIAERLVGPGQPCFVIAEAGVNHNGSLELALKLVDAAAEAGADAVKFQTFKAAGLVSESATKAEYQKNTTSPEESQYQMLRRLELNEEMHRAIVAHCRERGILFLSSPFDEGSADLLEQLGVPAFKLGSGELTNQPLLEHVARKRRPMILSTGMADLVEVAGAVDAMERAGHAGLVLLHCVSNYPADPADANLRAMHTLQDAFGVPTGFSDHTEGDAVAIAAAALGATVIEKHLTLDRRMPGPDHRASMEPADFSRMVQRIRSVQLSLGSGDKKTVAAERAISLVARKSLVALRDLRRGETLATNDVGARRPAGGMEPTRISEVIGRRARVDIVKNALLEPGMLE